MLSARLQALLAGDRGYHTEYHWASLEQVSPQAALAVIAAQRDQTITQLISAIDAARTPDRPLASALRVTAITAQR